MSKVVEVTDQDFDKHILDSDLPTEVDFWAPWCGPCMMVSPIYDRLSEEYQGRFKFCKLNVDENQKTAIRFQVMSIPMQMFFAEGDKVDEILGAVPEHTIRAKVEEILDRFPTDERSRLKTLLASWTEHNRQYGEKLGKWADKASNLESDPLYKSVVQAARDVGEANERLFRLSAELRRQQ